MHNRLEFLKSRFTQNMFWIIVWLFKHWYNRLSYWNKQLLHSLFMWHLYLQFVHQIFPLLRPTKLLILRKISNYLMNRHQIISKLILWIEEIQRFAYFRFTILWNTKFRRTHLSSDISSLSSQQESLIRLAYWGNKRLADFEIF